MACDAALLVDSVKDLPLAQTFPKKKRSSKAQAKVPAAKPAIRKSPNNNNLISLGNVETLVDMDDTLVDPGTDAQPSSPSMLQSSSFPFPSTARSDVCCEFDISGLVATTIAGPISEVGAMAETLATQALQASLYGPMCRKLRSAGPMLNYATLRLRWEKTKA